MKLIVFAHRAEAQAFLKSRYLAFKAEAFAFDGLYYSTEHNLALLLTGEGIQSATEKLASVCGAKYSKITEIINFGVAGILEKSSLFSIGDIVEVRTSYLSLDKKMEFKSFSSSLKSSHFNLYDIVTSSKRALKKVDCENLLPFAPLVDREAWAIGSVANRFHIPFRSIKLLSDKVFEAEETTSMEVCQLVRNQAPQWSQRLLDAFYKITSLNMSFESETFKDKKTSNGENPLLNLLEKSTSFHVTTSQKRKIKALWDILLPQFSGQKALMKKLEEYIAPLLSTKKGTPKFKTSTLIGQLENLASPFKSKFHTLIDKETKALREARCDIKFSDQFETDSVEISLNIQKPKDALKFQIALEQTNFTSLQKLLNGKWELQKDSPNEF